MHFRNTLYKILIAQNVRNLGVHTFYMTWKTTLVNYIKKNFR